MSDVVKNAIGVAVSVRMMGLSALADRVDKVAGDLDLAVHERDALVAKLALIEKICGDAETGDTEDYARAFSEIIAVVFPDD